MCWPFCRADERKKIRISTELNWTELTRLTKIQSNFVIRKVEKRIFSVWFIIGHILFRKVTSLLCGHRAGLKNCVHSDVCACVCNARSSVLTSVKRIGFIGVKFYTNVHKNEFVWLVQIVSHKQKENETLLFTTIRFALKIYDATRKCMQNLLCALLNDFETNQCTQSTTHYIQIKPFLFSVFYEITKTKRCTCIQNPCWFIRSQRENRICSHCETFKCVLNPNII